MLEQINSPQDLKKLNGGNMMNQSLKRMRNYLKM